MKKLSKVVSALAALALIVTSFAGCDSTTNERREYNGTLTYYVGIDGNATAAGITDNSEMMLYQEMEKRTGIKIDFIHPAKGAIGNEAYTTMFLDDELPDIIKYGWDAYPGGPSKAIEDGVIIALDEEVKDFQNVAPNYWKYVNDAPENTDRRRVVTTEEGNYYGFCNLNLGETKGFAGLFIRKDWLDKVGLAIPTTIDEWDNVFAAAKADGIKKPFTAGFSYLSFQTSSVCGFQTAYDVGSWFYLDDVDGKRQVVFAPNQPGYADYLAKMAEWFGKGYFDPDICNVGADTINQNLVDGTSIASIGYVGSSMGKIIPAGKAKHGDSFSVVACPFPKDVKTGKMTEFQMCYNPATATANAITYQCGNYEEAARWCDYVYGEEGMVLQLFGLEGVHHNVVMKDMDGDGKEEKHYEYTELISKPETSNCNTVAEAMYKYMLPCNYPGYNQHIDYLMGYYQEADQKAALEIWNEPAGAYDSTNADEDKVTDKPQEHQLPSITLTEDENTKFNELRTSCSDSLNAVMMDVVMGKKTINDWNDAVKKYNDQGFTEMLKIQNDAYQRYLNK